MVKLIFEVKYAQLLDPAKETDMSNPPLPKETDLKKAMSNMDEREKDMLYQLLVSFASLVNNCYVTQNKTSPGLEACMEKLEKHHNSGWMRIVKMGNDSFLGTSVYAMQLWDANKGQYVFTSHRVVLTDTNP